MAKTLKANVSEKKAEPKPGLFESLTPEESRSVLDALTSTHPLTPGDYNLWVKVVLPLASQAGRLVAPAERAG